MMIAATPNSELKKMIQKRLKDLGLMETVRIIEKPGQKFIDILKNLKFGTAKNVLHEFSIISLEFATQVTWPCPHCRHKEIFACDLSGKFPKLDLDLAQHMRTCRRD